MELFDTHSHYNDEQFDDDDIDELIKDTYNSGVTKFACIGCDLESSKKAIKIAENYDFIYPTVAIGPFGVTEKNLDELDEIRDLAKNNNIVAIGEIGLDYHWDKDNKDLQKELFVKQIEIANELDLPIAIHTRDAYLDTIDIVKNVKRCNNTGIFHCCPLNVELIKDGLELGYYISFSGVITFKNAKPELAVKEVPMERILIETDSPYLSPEPYRGKRNDSRNVIEIARKIAEIKNISLEEVAKATYENAKRVYKIA